MKIFTIKDGEVDLGVLVERYLLFGGNQSVPAIIIGDVNSGKRLGTMRVHLLKNQWREWENNNITLHYAYTATDGNGKWELFAESESEYEDSEKQNAFCVFRTSLGRFDTNSHTGDVTNKNIFGYYEYANFPGKVLCRVNIAEERIGEQIIAIMYKDCVFRTSCPSISNMLSDEIEDDSHFYRWEPRSATLHGGYDIRGRMHEAVFDRYLDVRSLV